MSSKVLASCKPVFLMNRVFVLHAPAQSYMTTDCKKFFAEFADLIAHLRTLEWVDADGNLSSEISDPIDLFEFFLGQEYCKAI